MTDKKFDHYRASRRYSPDLRALLPGQYPEEDNPEAIPAFVYFDHYAIEITSEGRFWCLIDEVTDEIFDSLDEAERKHWENVKTLCF